MTEPHDNTAQNSGGCAMLQLERVTTSLEHFDARIRRYVRRNPGKCLLGAILTGYIIGRVARRT